MLSAHLKATAAETGSGITFPPSTAQKRVLPNGLTIIVQEDRSAPVASVQAWCGTGSVDENAHLGAGLSHILEHMLFKGTKTNPANAIAQKVRTWAVTSMPTRRSIAPSIGSTSRRT